MDTVVRASARYREGRRFSIGRCGCKAAADLHLVVDVPDHLLCVHGLEHNLALLACVSAPQSEVIRAIVLEGSPCLLRGLWKTVFGHLAGGQADQQLAPRLGLARRHL